MLGVFLFVGATVVTILLERLNVDTPWLVVIAAISYGAAALVGWWPRWRRAWVAFWTGQSEMLGHGAADLQEQIARLESELRSAQWLLDIAQTIASRMR